jgi:hypothetical protein
VERRFTISIPWASGGGGQSSSWKIGFWSGDFWWVFFLVFVFWCKCCYFYKIWIDCLRCFWFSVVRGVVLWS